MTTTTPRAPGKFGIAATLCALLALGLALLDNVAGPFPDLQPQLRYTLFGSAFLAVVLGTVGYLAGGNRRGSGIGVALGGVVILLQLVVTIAPAVLGILVLLAILGSLGLS